MRRKGVFRCKELSAMTVPYPRHAEQTDDVADMNHNSQTGVIHVG